LAVTIPVGHLDAVATIGPLSRETAGWGFGDITTRAQLGWQRGDFSHLVYVQAVAPTGRSGPGFPPTIGLHRPGIDTGWAFTREHKPSKLQFNGSTGLTSNFEDTETDYKTGNEFPFEWAIGREFATGLVIGIVGYDYRQLTGDPGAGALRSRAASMRSGSASVIRGSLTRPRSSSTCASITTSMPKTGGRAMRR